MKNNFWINRKVLVTGGTGFIGSHVVEKLVDKRARVSVLDHLTNGEIKNITHLQGRVNFIRGDCTNLEQAQDACEDQDVVMNLAAKVGGIEYNRTHQATMLRENLLIATIMTEAAKNVGVKRFLTVSSACVYPHNCTVPTPESEGFLGDPEPTNSGYGWAKRIAELLAKTYTEEFGMQIGIVRPYNCYGPRDRFDPETSHVIPALIRRVFNGEDPITVWGSGNQTRAFLYVEDLAEGMILAIEKYPIPDPINLGTDEEVSIKELVTKIIKISDMERRVLFDKSKPDGSPRRNSDNRKAQAMIGFKPKVSLEEGLRQTIAWYKENVGR